MKVVIHTGSSPAWTETLGRPWALLTFANRPWIEFWIEWCSACGLTDIIIVLGDGAYDIEQYLGNGSRWGVNIQYSFLKDASAPEAFLRRDPARWDEGLFYIRRPVFPRRRQPEPEGTLDDTTRAVIRAGEIDVLMIRDPAVLKAWLNGGDPAAAPFPSGLLEPHPVESLKDYFDLNMAMVDGEIANYLTPGYRRTDNAYLGFNVIYPASAEIIPPVIIGNDVRLRALCNIGPRVILGNRIIVDRQAEISNAIILDGSYLGVGIELKDRIVAGRRLIDPEDGTAIDLDDTHLIAPLRASGARGETLRRIAHRLAALLLFVVIAPLALPLLAIGALFGGRITPFGILGVRGPCTLPGWQNGPRGPGLITHLSIDRWMLLASVVLGRLWLCGQTPVGARELDEAKSWPTYRPGLFSYADLRPADSDPVLRRIEAAYYAYHRGWTEDARLLVTGWWGRVAGRDRPDRLTMHDGGRA